MTGCAKKHCNGRHPIVLRRSRVRAASLADSLRAGGRGSDTGRRLALRHLLLVFVDLRSLHGFALLAPLVLFALLTLVGISPMAFFYTWVFNPTQNVLVCVLLHGSFKTATGFVPAHRGISRVPLS